MPLVVIPFLACLPREDLASYSTNTGGAGGAAPGPSTAGSSSSDAGGEPAGGQGGEGNPTELPLAPGGMGALAGADASAAGDAGSAAGDAGAAVDAGALLADASAAASQCSANEGTLVPNGDACLIVVAEARVSWQAASLGCQSRNASLVSVKTMERDGFLTSLIDTEIWLGAFDPGTNPAANAFVWRDQTPVDLTMEAWADMEPDGAGDQFCVSKSPPAMGGQWRDRPCSELRAYVCELPL